MNVNWKIEKFVIESYIFKIQNIKPYEYVKVINIYIAIIIFERRLIHILKIA